MENEIELLYKKYCLISCQNNSQPIWFEDAFINTTIPESSVLTRHKGELIVCSSARVQLANVKLSGAGRLTLIIGFGAQVDNLTLNIMTGDLMLFIGPYAEIKNVVVQSFDDNNYLFFGAGNTLNTANLLVQGAGSGIFCGHDCMFSTHVHARTSDSHSMFSYQSGQRINLDASIKIGDHCWLGRQVIINKGVLMDDDIIVGQGSIVNGHLESASCYAGVPAKKLRDNVTWDRARALHVDDIQETMCFRPKQQVINSFLLTDDPFHPNSKRLLSDVRSEYKIKKNYPWIPDFKTGGFNKMIAIG